VVAKLVWALYVQWVLRLGIEVAQPEIRSQATRLAKTNFRMGRHPGTIRSLIG